MQKTNKNKQTKKTNQGCIKGWAKGVAAQGHTLTVHRLKLEQGAACERDLEIKFCSQQKIK